MDGTLTTMEKVKRDWHTWLNTLGTFVTLGTLVFYGGALWSTVGNHESRITHIETAGSNRLMAHEAADTVEMNAMKARVTNVEKAFDIITAVLGDIRVINTKLDKLSEDLNQHEKNMSLRSHGGGP